MTSRPGTNSSGTTWMPDARRLARRIIEALTSQEREALAAEPFSGLQAMGFSLRMRPEREIVGSCSVAGSLDHGPPPTITVVMAASTGRQHFSALHEFGHWAIRADTEIHDDFFEESDGGVRLEEDVCDAMAGELLIPDEHVAQYIDKTGPTARSVIGLIRSTPNGSREACCVRAAERLFGPGHVMLTRNGMALFTASHSTPYRVRRNTPQGDGHITLKAAQVGALHGESTITYASGVSSNTFFADAAVDGEQGFVVAVFMEGRPPWVKGVALPRHDAATDAEVECFCTHCEIDFTGIGRPCPRCDGYVHHGQEGCGKCACRPQAAQVLCGGCFLRRPPSDFTRNPSTCDICLG